MEFFYVVKATQKSGKQDATVWFTAKSEARANLMLDVVLEDAEIETGRGKDYARPIRTNFPVVNELPPEGEISFTFTNYYRLGEDGMTWEQIPGVTLPSSESAAAARQRIVDGVNTETGEVLEDHNENFENKDSSPTPELTVVATMPLRHRVLAQYIGEGEYLYHVDASQKKEILRLEMDTDNSYVQNLLLAAENVEAFKKAIEHDIHKAVNAIKNVFPVDRKIPELGTIIQFLKTWFDTEHIDRGLLVKEWAKGNRTSAIQRTESGANAGGGNKTDRNPDYEHTLDTLDVEIAMATLPMDFNIYKLPGSVYRRAKEIVKKKESPFKEWSAALRATPGILDYSRAAIFALIRSAHPEFYHYPGRLQGYINANLTETDHENPTEEALTAARHTPEKDAVEEANRQLAAARGEYVEGISDPNDPKWVKTGTSQPASEPELVKNVGNGIFDVTALLQNSATHGTKKATETTSNVQVQKTVSDEKQAGDALHTGKSSVETGEESHTSQQADVNQNTDSVAQNSDSVNQTEPVAAQTEPEAQFDEPAVVYPAYFEPGRYEGLPNEVYHAANGISSTQVKDARVSLMYYHARHVTKTIRRDSSDALTFGSLVHTISLEPEKLHEEFAVFPGVPADAFTNTDSLKAFIREYNADKPKAEQLKLTGKKEELQDAIRAVKPDAIFADEFEQQWRESVAGKTILSSEQLELATAIQQALFSNSDANSLLCNPERQSEVSYFGIDEETGLEIRVRPDIELRTAKDNICADLKTVTIGNVRQDRIKERLHREIIDRDYHLSAAMYCDVAGLDSFSWIFVNKEPGYHWVAVVQASEAELELGRQEYRRVLRQINDAMENDIWPAPIIGTYTDELNDYDLRRLQALAEE
ncbi:exodeoxyribonuclease VIII [Salmonella enterica subsp. enterica serovar Abaetetuba]|nr:exodeoxyribonuclease VIII [Salmonella enterica subsp. enterica serovar Abaetetuba]ECD1969448.1 exodeoxyribonuclease VIII [Salmonella enterica subsp. enterica serovar Abaetetuba]EJR4303906.1 PD-(D/E)XK nuclease-like domain-containing protein [Salmonella enterica]EJR4403729.1 PD-(D/E)XK nuclease-like domain-containing protein [Salmonella enterica]